MTRLEQDAEISSYKIIEKIGEGGMAEIYKAQQPALKRDVVIKKLKDPNREIIARFKKEALLSASFSQENVLAIYDFIYANRSYYLVMEYVDGEDLRTIIDCMSPLPVDIAVLIILEIAHGLEYTHNQNIIHRDIKPSNILISYDGNVKLIDFGVAKDETNTRLTVTGLIVGTPSYMSPEQAHGDPLSPQSDLYALGILLYELLTGLKPFFGNNNTEILARIVRSKYTPPNRINPEIPLRLRRVIRKLLKKDRRKRYRNAAALIHDLEKCVSWQTRSRKKIAFSRFLERLDKAVSTSTNDTLKAAFLERSRSWGWNSLRYSVIGGFIILMVMLLFNFKKKELGYIEISHSSTALELKIDNREIKQKISGKHIYGPYLRGLHDIEASDPVSNATFMAHSEVSPDDTTLIRIELRANTLSANVRFTTTPQGSDIHINNRLFDNRDSTLQLEPGWYDIQIAHNGYQSVNERIFLRAAETYLLEYTLLPNPD